MKSNLSQTQEKSMTLYQATEAEHVYEVPDKYSQEYAEVKIHDPPNKLKIGLDEAEDIELNTFPEAYAQPITASKTSAQELKRVEI